MCEEKTSGDMTSATSSRESAGGPTPSNSQVGATAPSGQAPVPVSRSRRRASGKAPQTVATSGLLFADSSPSGVLQRSLESRLRRRMAATGSPEYALTWKHWDMPSGGPICALRASALRTSGSGCTGWPTPMVFDTSGDTIEMKRARNARRRAAGKGKSPGSPTLPMIALLAGWATPTSRDHKGIDQNYHDGAINNSLLNQCAALASGANRLYGLARMGAGAGSLHERINLRGAAEQILRPMRSGKRYTLNPRFSLWLQGFPVGWASCGERAMLSCRKSRRSS